jgi:hypothetical protein
VSGGTGGSVYASQATPDAEATQRVGPFPPAPGRPVPPRPVTPPPTNYRQGQAGPVHPPTGQQQAYQQPGYQEPPYRESRYTDSAYAEPAYETGGGKRVVKTVLVTIMLVLVPLVCGFVAYQFTSGAWSLP